MTADNIEQKAIELKVGEGEGEVSAVVATLNVIDKDGDVTLPGAFGSQEVRMVWGHDWTDPIGKGTLTEEGDLAIFKGSFFLDTEAGSERWKLVKAMGDLQEWSYGFHVIEGGAKAGEFDGQAVRMFQSVDGGPGLKVHEVSPVLVGAGEGTMTLDIKNASSSNTTSTTAEVTLDEGMRFAEQADQAMEAVKELLDRAESIRQLRKDGRLGADSLERLLALSVKLGEFEEVVTSLTQSPRDGFAARMAAEHAQYELTKARLTAGGGKTHG